MSAITNRRGHTTTVSWNTFGHVVGATWPGTPGGSIALAPAEARGLLVPHDPAAAAATIDGPRTDVSDITQFWVNRDNAPVRTRNALQQEAFATYHPIFRTAIASTTAPNGFQRVFRYNGRGLLDSIIARAPLGGPDSAVTRIWWHPTCNQPTQVIDPTSRVSTYGYGAFCNRAWEQRGPDLATRVHYAYHGAGAGTGQLHTVTTPLGLVTRLTYDGLGNLDTARSPSGVRRAWSSQPGTGYVATSAEPLDLADSASLTFARRSQTWYDAFGRDTLTWTWAPTRGPQQPADTLRVKTVYDPMGNRLRVERTYRRQGLPRLTQSMWTYDAAQRVLTETPTLGATSTSWYDAAGNRIRVQSPRGPGDTVAMQYDALNRLVQRVTPTVMAPAMSCWTLRADWGGWCNFSMPTRQAFDSPSALCIPADTAIFAYDVNGNLIRADNGASRIRRTYYPNGLVATDTQRIRTYYTSQPGPCGGAEPPAEPPPPPPCETNPTLPHCGGGGEQQRAPAGGTSPTSSGTRSRQRPPGGPFAETERDADSWAAQPGPNADFSVHVFGIRYEYDLAGRRTGLHHPSMLCGWSNPHCRQAYAYTAAGLLQHTTDLQGRTFAFGYDLEHRRSTINLAGLAWHQVSYDLDGGVSTLDAAGRVDQVLRDAQGRVTDASSLRPGGGGGTVVNRYGALGAVVYAQSPSGIDTYQDVDGLGNRLLRRQQGYQFNWWDDGWRTFGFDDDGRATWMQNTTPTVHFFERDDHLYDGAGNRVGTNGRVNSPAENIHDTQRVWYDAEGRLRVANRHLGIDQVSAWHGPARRPVFDEYRYDALGRRVLVRSRFTGPGGGANWAQWQASYVERTVYDGDQVLWEIRAPGRDGAAHGEMENDYAVGEFHGRVGYTHGGGIDQPLALHRDGHPVRGTGFFSVIPLANWRGSYEEGLDDVGNPTGHVVPWPGLSVTADGHQPNGPASDAWFGSLIQNSTDGTGLQYKRNRHYDPVTGQFTQSDPIGVDGGLNLYGFAGGDPLNFDDPFGLCPQWLTGRPCSEGVDFGASFVPGVSSGIDAATVLSGQNPLTGEDVGLLGRGIALAGLLTPVSGGQIRGAGKFLTSAERALAKESGNTFTVIVRKALGRDGASSAHLIENDAAGRTISKTHRVVGADGQIIHQHQTHIGKNGTERQFPNKWVQFPDKPE